MTPIYFENEDVITQRLKALYEGAGYAAYKIRKFEEYALYLDNRSFLSDEHIITFTDQNGRLLALKPDVTLSIVKNRRATQGHSEKLYYRETVYRYDKHAGQYREINQMGLELLGDVTVTEELEILELALTSLSALSANYRLTLSHMGLVNGILTGLGLSPSQKEEAIGAIGSKNVDGLSAILARAGASEEVQRAFSRMLTVPADTCRYAAALASTREASHAFEELFSLKEMLDALGYGDKVQIDLSVTQGTEYYNGLVFRGYAEGLSAPVLSGGRYDRLAQKFSPDTRAIGFAVYLGELLYHRAPTEYDTDVLLLQGEDTDPVTLLTRARELREEGQRVRVERRIPDGIRYRTLIKL
ncbi:MAG: ATP phosphoribosyltransferase regulatory subunit [Clostridia bacterium]|nr:ATP phosphoribosyltransferase regulatory subunit [Clostridia bacterium]